MQLSYKNINYGFELKAGFDLNLPSLEIKKNIPDYAIINEV